ncbi:MAG: YbaB/EbfC family nucleoid-associated protein [Phycisphaerales bacterium]
MIRWKKEVGVFDGLKSMAGMAGLLKDLPKIQAKAQVLREEIAQIEVRGRSGGGAVVVRATGAMEIVSIEISEPIRHAMTNPDQQALAHDLVREAVNDALREARGAAAAKMEAAARELGLPISPGMIPGLG